MSVTPPPPPRYHGARSETSVDHDPLDRTDVCVGEREIERNVTKLKYGAIILCGNIQIPQLGLNSNLLSQAEESLLE